MCRRDGGVIVVTWLAIIPAAGAGKRMGVAKAILVWHGEMLAISHARAAVLYGCESVLVVIRESVKAKLGSNPPHTHWVVSHASASEGQAGSLRVAVESEHFRRDIDWIAVSPVDVEPIAWECVPELLVSASKHQDAQVIRPVFGAYRGHPVLVKPEVLSGYLGNRSGVPLRTVISQYKTVYVPLNNPAVITDLDEPSDTQ